MSSTRYFVFIIAAALLMLPACKKNRGDEASERAQEQAARALETLLPGDIDNAVLIRNLSDAFSGVGPMLDRAQAFVGDLSPVEADIRNTLGVDVRHPEQLASLGIDPTGQAILSRRSSHMLIAVSLNDAEKFVAHATQVLQGAPFSLRAPVTEESQSGARVVQFRRAEDEAARASLIVRDRVGIILLSSSEEPPRLEDYLADAETSLADNEAYHATVQGLEGYPIVIWGDPKSVYARRSGDLALASAQQQVDAVVDASQTGGLGLDIKGDRLRGEFAVSFEPGDELEELKSIYLRGDQAPTFAGVATTDAYALTRIIIDPELYMRSLFERLADVDSALDESARKTALDGIVERDFDATVVPAFGTHLFMANTRARVITLSSALNREGPKKLSDLTDSFGLVISLELRERAPIQFVIDKLIEKGHLTATKREEEGAIVYDISDADDPLGALILEDHRMTLVPRRQARELTTQILSGETPTLEQFHAEEARTLVDRTNDGGMAIDVDEVLNGPFGNLMGNAIPDQLRSSFNLFDEAWIRWSFQQDTLRAPFQIILNEAPEH